MRRIIVLCLIICAMPVLAASRFGDTRCRLYLEIDQIFVLKVGSEYSISPDWGVKGALGASVFGITTAGYELIGVYHVMDADRKFQIDVEFGLPLAYFDVFEGNLVDWDSHIDAPYAGWAPGISAAWGFRFASSAVLSLKTGVLTVFEYQRDSGWREDRLILPEVSLQWLAAR